MLLELPLKELQELSDPVRLSLAGGLIEPLETLADSSARGRPVWHAGGLDWGFTGHGLKF